MLQVFNNSFSSRRQGDNKQTNDRTTRKLLRDLVTEKCKRITLHSFAPPTVWEADCTRTDAVPIWTALSAIQVVSDR